VSQLIFLNKNIDISDGEFVLRSVECAVYVIGKPRFRCRVKQIAQICSCWRSNVLPVQILVTSVPTMPDVTVVFSTISPALLQETSFATPESHVCVFTCQRCSSKWRRHDTKMTKWRLNAQINPLRHDASCFPHILFTFSLLSLPYMRNKFKHENFSYNRQN